ncbi:hypothetical protein GCM10009530_07970 [Microbispora corallina]|uniref:Uncharacterized protein n=1 Tax=Microbispora corallina TaxID=83302 RepID=A0ABQ4FVC6_9ACTN|nr:hypothetical protein [Microbispora corallina]GIH38760.1 hypothetical protein Mco01_17600 [Microbispora corallina]
MLKRLLLTVALAASSLLVGGTMAATAHASGPGGSAPRHALTPAADCVQRGDCTYCYSYRTARWDLQSCGGDSSGD